MNIPDNKCAICGETLPPEGQRYFFTLGPYSTRRSRERFCSTDCASIEREHVIEELEAGLVTEDEVMEGSS